MLSIIITTHREEETIGRAIKAFLAQSLPQEYELLVVCPDDETASVVSDYMKLNGRIKCLRDRGKGKLRSWHHLLTHKWVPSAAVRCLSALVTRCWATGLTSWSA